MNTAGMTDHGLGCLSGTASGPPVAVDDLRPNLARMHDYLLGGKDHFPADREAAERALAAFPTLRTAARENRGFLGRAVRHLVQDAGITQFLDIGSGLPTADNVHQVAGRHHPGARVVYVDNDPIVLTHGRAMLERQDLTAVIQADARRPRAILDHPGTRGLLDFSRPVGVLLVALLHFVGDADDPAGIVRTLCEAMPPGSHLVLTHPTADLHPGALKGQAAVRSRGVAVTLRSRSAIESFFAGLDLVEPGVQVVSVWRPEVPEERRPSHAEVSWYGGIGRLP